MTQEACSQAGRSEGAAAAGAGGDRGRSLSVPRHARRRPATAAAGLAGAHRRLHGLRREPQELPQDRARSRPIPRSSSPISAPTTISCGSPAGPRCVTDRSLLREIWDANPLLRHYLGSLDNPELIVYRILPERVRFMREWSLEYHEVPLDSDRPDSSSGATVDHPAGAHDRGSRSRQPARSARQPRS